MVATVGLPEDSTTARRDQTLRVFSPERKAGASARNIKGLSAIGVKQKHYQVTEDSDCTSLYWPVFSLAQIDTLRQFEARNIKRAHRRPDRRSYDDEFDFMDEDDDSDQDADSDHYSDNEAVDDGNDGDSGPPTVPVAVVASAAGVN